MITYWNQVKSQLQAETINILSDLRNEALDVSKINAWVTYSEPLQRFREFGTNTADFNALAEHLLTPRQLRLFCAHL